MQYLRARFYNASLGTLSSLDRFRGANENPATFHKYSYGWNDPTNISDPSGNEGTLVGLNASLGSMQEASRQDNKNAFATGGQVLGQYHNTLGKQAQDLSGEIIRTVIPKAQLAANRTVSKLNKSKIDWIIRAGGKKLFMEVKYSLPKKAGSALTCLVNQIKTMNAAKNGRILVWTAQQPTKAQIALIKKQVGSQIANRIVYKTGVYELTTYLLMVF